MHIISEVPLNICVLSSGKGSNLKSLLISQKNKKFTSKIALIISNNSKSGVLEIAKKKNIPSFHISRKQFNSDSEFENKILSILSQFKIDLIILAGYMKLLSAAIIRKYKNRIINVHPSLLPAFSGKGIYGYKVHEEVLNAGVKVTGATVHIVNEEYDKGPIILQKAVKIDINETSGSLQKKVLKAENKLLQEAIRLYENKKIKLAKDKVIINL